MSDNTNKAPQLDNASDHTSTDSLHPCSTESRWRLIDKMKITSTSNKEWREHAFRSKDPNAKISAIMFTYETKKGDLLHECFNIKIAFDSVKSKNTFLKKCSLTIQEYIKEANKNKQSHDINFKSKMPNFELCDESEKCLSVYLSPMFDEQNLIMAWNIIDNINTINPLDKTVQDILTKHYNFLYISIYEDIARKKSDVAKLKFFDQSHTVDSTKQSVENDLPSSTEYRHTGIASKH